MQVSENRYQNPNLSPDNKSSGTQSRVTHKAACMQVLEYLAVNDGSR